MQRFRERLALVVLLLLPFHALLVTVFTKVLAGPMHAPLRALSLWKEAAIALLVILALIEIVTRRKELTLKADALDMAILALFIVAPAVSFGLNDVPLKQFLYGAKYDLLPLAVFVVLRRVPWSQDWKMLVRSLLPLTACVIVLYGLVALVLPQSFFSALGYSDLHSLYQPGAPIAPFQQVMGTAMRRMQSVMSGPNQLGLWLLLPWSIVIVDLLKRRFSSDDSSREWGMPIVFAFVIGLGILLTFSRAAWISSIVIVAVGLWYAGAFAQRRMRSMSLIAAAAVVVVCVAVAALFPQVLLRVASSRAHFDKPVQAFHTMMAAPLGSGLGTAGPASNMLSDTCVQLQPGDDPSWATAHPQLCVFVGEEQVQPSLRELRPAGQPASPCNCPMLTENWYLQIGVELGIAGMVIFLWLVLMVLWREVRVHSSFTNALSLALLGVSIAGLFLHAWEDSAVAYGVWMLLAAGVSARSLSSDGQDATIKS
jgi:hypothetical protein